MSIWLWVGFIAFVLLMLALDLGVLNRKATEIRTRKALLWSAFCGVLALAFTGFIYFAYEGQWFGINSGAGKQLAGKDAALQFLTGWVVEQSLSLDNIFVIAMIFRYFNVPLRFQHRTLFWGIIGALVMRLIMILIGAALIERFHFIIYVFGALLLYTAWKMLHADADSVDPDRNIFVRAARRLYPVSRDFDGERFLTRIPAPNQTGADANGAPQNVRMVTAATPLMLALVAIESSDVLFAVDSIPAIFAITTDPFIVFTSNVFAILNLRSLYFALADLLDRFKLLKYSLVVILAYVGVKMMISQTAFAPPAGVTFSVIAVSLAVGILVSLRATKNESKPDSEAARKASQAAAKAAEPVKP